MQVNNSLVQNVVDVGNKVVEYECNGQMVKLSPNIIKQYLVNGNGKVTDQEVVMFLNLCKFQKLNPFLREAYLIKFGSQPATIVTGKEAITKRAMRNANFAGQQAGVVVVNVDGDLENRIGTIVLDGETLVGGWAKAFIKGYETPVEVSVALSEYIGTKSDGTVNSNWQKRPASMIRKVALVQALREAFPEDLGGMYAAEERVVDDAELPANVIDENIVEAESVEVAEEEPIQEAATDVQQALFGR